MIVIILYIKMITRVIPVWRGGEKKGLERNLNGIKTGLKITVCRIENIGSCGTLFKKKKVPQREQNIKKQLLNNEKIDKEQQMVWVIMLNLCVLCETRKK